MLLRAKRLSYYHQYFPTLGSHEMCAVARVAGARTFTPVSYTHLDVYKRQIYYYASSREITRLGTMTSQ